MGRNILQVMEMSAIEGSYIDFCIVFPTLPPVMSPAARCRVQAIRRVVGTFISGQQRKTPAFADFDELKYLTVGEAMQYAKCRCWHALLVVASGSSLTGMWLACLLPCSTSILLSCTY